MKYPKTPMAWLPGLAALVLEVPVAIVTVPACQRFWFKSKIGIDFESSPREVAKRVAIKLLERFGNPMNVLNTSIQSATSIGTVIHDSSRYFIHQ